MKYLKFTAVTIFLLAILYGAYSVLGAGAFERHMTIGGIYAVCKPKGYDVICFGDSSSKEGGISCLPLNGAPCR